MNIQLYFMERKNKIRFKYKALSYFQFITCEEMDLRIVGGSKSVKPTQSLSYIFNSFHSPHKPLTDMTVEKSIYVCN